MAVTTVREKWQGRAATTDERGVRTLERRWDVETNPATTGVPAVIDGVIAADPSAELYAQHPDWPWAVCRELTGAPNGGPQVWTVTAKYSTATLAGNGDGSGTPSLADQSQNTPADLRPPTITVSRKEVTKLLERDAVTGARVVNTLGDPFNPPPEVFRAHHVFTWKFHRLPADLRWFARAAFHDSINDAPFAILGLAYPARSLRCTEYGLDAVWDTGAAGLQLFFALTVQAEYNPDLWDVKILNTGRRKRIGGSLGDPDNPPKLVGIVDDQGKELDDPVPLTAAGVPVAVGGTFHYVEANGYVPRDWTLLLA